MIGVLFAAIEIASGFGSLAAGRAMRWGDPQKTMLSGTVASILFICATPFLGGIFLLLLLAQIGRGWLQGVVQPMMFSVQAKAVGRYRQGSVVGLRQTSNRLSSIVIPPIMGVIADWWGMTESFVVLGVALLLICVPIARITRRAAQAPAVQAGARAGLNLARQERIGRCRTDPEAADPITTRISTPGRSTRPRCCARCRATTTASTAKTSPRRSRIWARASAMRSAAKSGALSSICSNCIIRRPAIRGRLDGLDRRRPRRVGGTLSATLRRDLDSIAAAICTAAHESRRNWACAIMRKSEAAAALPTECPYTLDQILEDDWYPEPPAQEET